MLKGDCNECIYGDLPEDSEVCHRCGIARKNYTPRLDGSGARMPIIRLGYDGYGIEYDPVAGTILVTLPNPRDKVINELHRYDVENILDVVKELCERE